MPEKPLWLSPFFGSLKPIPVHYDAIKFIIISIAPNSGVVKLVGLNREIPEHTVIISTLSKKQPQILQYSTPPTPDAVCPSRKPKVVQVSNYEYFRIVILYTG